MTRRDRRWLDSWSGSHYDPRTRRIVIVGRPPDYVIEHERAHAAQHKECGLLWLLWRLLRRLPLLGQRLRLRLEIDADRRARAALIASGRWTARNQRAARLVMSTYRLHRP